MNEDKILEEANTEELRDAVWARTPNSKCFGMTPIEAFSLCAEAFARMKEKGEIASEQIGKFRTVITGSSTTDDTIRDTEDRVINTIIEPPLKGRKALVAHTKRKIEYGES